MKRAQQDGLCAGRAAPHGVEAAKEGGFLGIGGTKVNEAETTALRDLAGSLGIPA